jgi:hypothetical protein
VGAETPLRSTATVAPASAGGDPIEHTVQTQWNGLRTESWTDLTTGRRRSVTTREGRPFVQNVMGFEGGGLRSDTVSYDARIWTTSLRAVPAPKGETVAQLGQRYRDVAARGVYDEVGHAQVDGRDTIHLRRSLRVDSSLGRRTLVTDLWLDALSYPPVRQRSSTHGTPSAVEQNYDWLPRTQANLAKLELVVPDGFKHKRQSSAGCSSSGVSWLVIHVDNVPSLCTGSIVVGHS